ncbi:MAG: transcription termination factor Rho [Clostridia bacterium]|jgi:transcription termination factor Rho|nr:transcription termination factor Rho [Clostridia bacterium]
MQEAFEKMTLAQLRLIAKELGLKSVSALKKKDLIDKINKAEKLSGDTDTEEKANNEIAKSLTKMHDKDDADDVSSEITAAEKSEANDKGSKTEKKYENEERQGVLEVHPDGYGFLRAENFLPGSGDIYISQTQIRRFNLKTGDLVNGYIRQSREGEKFNAIIYVKTVNGDTPDKSIRRPSFEELTPIYPTERLTLESFHCDISSRMIDLISPIGKGQRGMIVAQPKVGKTTLLKGMANAIAKNYKDVNLIMLLIDERPEEVTDIQRSISGDKVEIVYSTFDEQPEHHKRVAEMVLERSKRLVEQGKDVVVLLDSITRLARAYNLTTTPSGRTLSGGLDPAALYMPKKFFGAARNIENGGSLTILATALIETGSKMDDVVFEEFKGTGNMELVLDRRVAERRIFPAIDINKSGTRRDDMLLSHSEMDAMYKLRELISNLSVVESTEEVINLMKRTKNNAEFIQTVTLMVQNEGKK